MGGDMGAKDSGSGIELRKGARSETIRIVFHYQGKRCREPLKLEHTKKNIAYAQRLRGEVINAIERGTFVYHEFFPESETAKEYAKAQASTSAPAPVAPLTVGELLRDYLSIAKRNLALSSFNCYVQVAENHLFPRWDQTPAAELTSKEMRKWIMTLTGKRKTIQLILTPLRNAIDLAVNEEVIDANPFDSIKLAKILAREQRSSVFKADPFDIDEIEGILAACDREQERNMFLFALLTGMRPSEYIALNWSAVDVKRHQVGVEGAFVDGEMKDTAKTLKGLRTIDLRQGALEALLAQEKFTKAKDALVFLNPLYGEQWAGDKPIHRRWRRILRSAGVRYRNPYQTRHTFASNLLMLGAVPMYVATQMGHADTTMIVRTYGKWIGEGMDSGKRVRVLRLYAQTNPKRSDEFPKFD
jgi:integrase